MGIVLITPHLANAQFPVSCLKMSTLDNCYFYSKCLEAKNPCGPEGYPLGFGLKYCQIFNKIELTVKGGKWFTDTMGCLQDVLVPFAENKTPCDTIKKEAFKSHVKCYLVSGFCDLPFSDQAKIAATNLCDTVSSMAAVEHAATTLMKCLKDDD